MPDKLFRWSTITKSAPIIDQYLFHIALGLSSVFDGLITVCTLGLVSTSLGLWTAVQMCRWRYRWEKHQKDAVH